MESILRESATEKLGDLLIQEGLITQEQHNLAQEIQQKQGGLISQYRRPRKVN
jgi:hypothetical protein